MPSKFKLERQAAKGDTQQSQVDQHADLDAHRIDKVEDSCKNSFAAKISTQSQESNPSFDSAADRSVSQRASWDSAEQDAIPSVSANAKPILKPTERNESIPDKVQRYEAFVEDTLRAKLREISVPPPSFCFLCQHRPINEPALRQNASPSPRKWPAGRSSAAASTSSRPPQTPPEPRKGRPPRCAPW